MIERAESSLDGASQEAIRRELERLTGLLRRHFGEGDPDSLLDALADTANPGGHGDAHRFLTQIRTLADSLVADSRRWANSAPIADALADFRQATLTIAAAVERRMGSRST